MNFWDLWLLYRALKGGGDGRSPHGEPVGVFDMGAWDASWPVTAKNYYDDELVTPDYPETF